MSDTFHNEVNGGPRSQFDRVNQLKDEAQRIHEETHLEGPEVEEVEIIEPSGRSKTRHTFSYKIEIEDKDHIEDHTIEDEEIQVPPTTNKQYYAAGVVIFCLGLGFHYDFGIGLMVLGAALMTWTAIKVAQRHLGARKAKAQ